MLVALGVVVPRSLDEGARRTGLHAKADDRASECTKRRGRLGALDVDTGVMLASDGSGPTLGSSIVLFVFSSLGACVGLSP